MSEPRAEWAKVLIETVEKLRIEITGLSTKMQEIATKQTAFQDKAQPYLTTLDVIKWATGLLVLAVVVAAFQANNKFSEISTTSAHHEKIITECGKI